jgi:UDP-N-acetylglucosamine diphosphorylase/glucosamine-1-phosphate N-acetyltransferase
VVVFEDDGWAGFGPLPALRHASHLRRGTKTLLDALVESVGDATEVELWGRPELEAVVKETSPKPYHEDSEGQALYVNARARPGRNLFELTSRRTPFAAFSGGSIVAARLASGILFPGVVNARASSKAAKKVEKLDAAEESLFGGYWDLVESNGLAIAEQAAHFDDSQTLPNSAEVRGPPSNLRIEGGADIELHVTFDVRLGPVVVESGASIESFSRVMGPCYIGPKSKLFSAQIGGGTSIFESCKVGGQVENSVIMPRSNKAHHGYVGDSYVGEWVNLGAGSTFSNLKNTYGNVRVDIGQSRQDSGAIKLGPVVGDMCKVSIGALVFAGKVVGTGSHVTGLAAVNVPSFTYFDGASGKTVELLLDSVVETQRRVMERRGMTLSRAEEGLIRRAFEASAPERRKAGVRKGRIG